MNRSIAKVFRPLSADGNNAKKYYASKKDRQRVKDRNESLAFGGVEVGVGWEARSFFQEESGQPLIPINSFITQRARYLPIFPPIS